MEKFTYSIQGKITVWDETTYTFHAENREKAEEIIRQVSQEGIWNIKDDNLQLELDNYEWKILEDTIGDLNSDLQPIEIYNEKGEVIESTYRRI
jgi:hypothetical protein